MTETTNGDRMLRFGRSLVATRRRRITAGVTAATLVLVGCGGAVYASTRADGETYRTAIAERADVSQTLTLTGQLAAATSRDVAFQFGGTVGSVLVKLGQTVTPGQQLATLDPEALDAAVTAAEDKLAQAKQQLEDDLETQQNGGSGGGGGSSGGGSSASGGAGPSSLPPAGDASSIPPGQTGPTAPPTPDPDGDGSGDGGSGGDGSGPGDGAMTDPAVTAAITAVADAQQALLAQYELTAQAQTASSQALTTAQGICAPFLDASLVVDQPAATDTDEAPAATTSNADDLKQLLTDCQSALADTQNAQASTTAEQSALTAQATALDDAVTALQKALAAAASDAGDSDSAGSEPAEQDPTTSPNAAASSFSGTASTPNVTVSVVHTSAVQTAQVRTVASASPSPSASGGATTVTAETILADRADIDAADAELTVAKRDRTLAALTSPIAGTVVSVGMAPGDAVTAGSTDAAIRVQAGDGYIVELSVPLAQVAGIAVGQSATADLAAFDASYDASVSSIGVENVSETSTPSYKVSIAVDADADAAQPRIGATTRVTITLATAKDVLTVPISAVSVDGSSASVIVLSDAGTKTVPVELGAVGSERVEITSGLSKGDRVVIADLSQPVGDEGSSSSSGLSGLGGSTSTRGGSGGFQPPAGFQPPGS